MALRLLEIKSFDVNSCDIAQNLKEIATRKIKFNINFKKEAARLMRMALLICLYKT